MAITVLWVAWTIVRRCQWAFAEDRPYRFSRLAFEAAVLTAFFTPTLYFLGINATAVSGLIAAEIGALALLGLNLARQARLHQTRRAERKGSDF